MRTTEILALAITALAAPSLATNAQNCAAKNPNINRAIAAFCNKDNLMVPTQYSENGVRVGNVAVSIQGTCKPAQWVPEKYCKSQFYELCASEPLEAYAINRWYGCQDFVIAAVGPSKNI